MEYTKKQINDFIKAAAIGDIKYVEDAIADGINVDVQNEDDETALISSVYNCEFEIAEMLMKEKANANLQDINGSTAILYAVRHSYAQEKINEELIELLKDESDLNIADENGMTPLTEAICQKDIDRVTDFIEHGGDISKSIKEAREVGDFNLVKTIENFAKENDIEIEAKKVSIELGD